MGENKGSKIYLIVAIVAIALIIVIIFGYIVPASQFQGIVPVHPVSTPQPIADVTLSPSNQVVVLSLSQQPNFSLTLSQNGHGNILFPCSVRILPSVIVTGFVSIPPNLYNYGTITQSTYSLWVMKPLQPETISYYAVIQDSTGAETASNTVTVQYK